MLFELEDDNSVQTDEKEWEEIEPGNWRRSPGLVKDCSTLNAGNSAVHLQWACQREGACLCPTRLPWECSGEPSDRPRQVVWVNPGGQVTLTQLLVHITSWWDRGWEQKSTSVKFVSWVYSLSLKKEEVNRRTKEKNTRKTRDANLPTIVLCQLTDAQAVPEQLQPWKTYSSAFIAEHKAIWHGMLFWSAWELPLNFFCTPSSLFSGQVAWGTEKALTV